jgi:hypothetical protein
LNGGICEQVDNLIRDQKTAVDVLCCGLRGVIDESTQMRADFDRWIRRPNEAGLKGVGWLVGLPGVSGRPDHGQEVPLVPELDWGRPPRFDTCELEQVKRMMGEVLESRRDQRIAE